jgi:hypothetical protein
MRKNRISTAVLAVLVLAAGAAGGCRPRGVAARGPVDWRGDPVQTPTDREAFRIATPKGLVSLQPRAAFDASGLVAGAERYRFDDGAFLVPLDVVLLWGHLPEKDWRRRIDYQQTGRFYLWTATETGVDSNYVQSHSSNMHLIPATPGVRRALLSLGRGDTLRLEGLLVDASTDTGMSWHTSLSREDGGAGACELVWVEEAQIGNRVFR